MTAQPPSLSTRSPLTPPMPAMSPRPIPAHYRDQRRAVIGGPTRENKTCFFATYEYTRCKTPSRQTATFPAPEQPNGHFSKTFSSDGRLITIYNPFDTYKDANGITKRN